MAPIQCCVGIRTRAAQHQIVEVRKERTKREKERDEITDQARRLRTHAKHVVLHDRQRALTDLVDAKRCDMKTAHLQEEINKLVTLEDKLETAINTGEMMKTIAGAAIALKKMTGTIPVSQADHVSKQLDHANDVIDEVQTLLGQSVAANEALDDDELDAEIERITAEAQQDERTAHPETTSRLPTKQQPQHVDEMDLHEIVGAFNETPALSTTTKTKNKEKAITLTV